MEKDGKIKLPRRH